MVAESANTARLHQTTMADRLESLHRLINERFPESRLAPLSSDELTAIKQEHPDIPNHLFDFYKTIGCGCVGNSRYMVHELLPPSDIYAPETAAELGPVVIVGDDFAGNCDAYDPTDGWQFGSIRSSGSFEPMGNAYPTIVDWLHFLFADD